MAKNRFATKACNAKDEPILVTLELNVHSMNVEIKSFPISTMSDNDVDDFSKKFTAEDESIVFPENTEVINRSFTEESLLPDHIKIDGKSGTIRQLQNEWTYLLISAKLYQQFDTDLDIIKQKAGELKGFSSELFDEAKEFWEKVLEYKKEKEISQEKLSYFKEEINGVFDHLKAMKESMLREKDEVTERVKTEISEALTTIESKLEEHGVHFKTVMEELKELQLKLRSEDIKRDVKNVLFDNVQSAFEKLKTKRDQVLGGANNSRIDGLNKVLERLEKTLELDKRDLEYNTKKLNSVNNKLELQLREAKINVLKDRIASKEEKLADILKTMKKLQGNKNSPKPEENEAKANIIESSPEEAKADDIDEINEVELKEIEAELDSEVKISED